MAPSLIRQGATTTYAYDGAGKRLSATSGGSVTNFSWDPNGALPELATERDASGGLIRRYVQGLGGPISLTTPGGTFTYHAEALGSIAALSSSGGTPVASYRYEPFGAERSGSSGSLPSGLLPTPENPLRFTGEYLDPTGLYHLRARSYDPGTGRFLSMDPLAPSPTEPYSGTYVYASNRPTVLIDPSGLRGIPSNWLEDLLQNPIEVWTTGWDSGLNPCNSDEFRRWVEGFSLVDVDPGLLVVKAPVTGLALYLKQLAKAIGVTPPKYVKTASGAVAWVGALSTGIDLGCKVGSWVRSML